MIGEVRSELMRIVGVERKPRALYLRKLPRSSNGNLCHLGPSRISLKCNIRSNSDDILHVTR